VLIGLLVLAGVGTAIFHPVAGAMVGAAAPPAARGRWMGLFITAGNFGNALGPLMLGLLLERTDQRGTWPIVLPALLMGCVVLLSMPRRPPPSGSHPSLGALLRQHRRVLSTLILVVTMRAWITAGLVTFLPLLARSRGLGLGEAAQSITVYLLAAALGGLVGGSLADRWGR